MRVLHGSKAQTSVLEADICILHSFALASAEKAHEVTILCSEVSRMHVQT